MLDEELGGVAGDGVSEEGLVGSGVFDGEDGVVELGEAQIEVEGFAVNAGLDSVFDTLNVALGGEDGATGDTSAGEDGFGEIGGDGVVVSEDGAEGLVGGEELDPTGGGDAYGRVEARGDEEIEAGGFTGEGDGGNFDGAGPGAPGFDGVIH